MSNVFNVELNDISSNSLMAFFSFYKVSVILLICSFA